jgi:hypothetical protein
MIGPHPCSELWVNDRELASRVTDSVADGPGGLVGCRDKLVQFKPGVTL